MLTHFEVKVAELMLKKTEFASDARAFASIVFPLLGGPNKSKPFAGDLKPYNKVTKIDA